MKNKCFSASKEPFKNAVYESRHSDFYYRSGKQGNLYLTCGTHLHYHIELVYIESGEVVAFQDSDTYTLSAGDMMIIFPNRVHSFEDISERIKYHLLIVSPELIPEFSEQFCGDVPISPIIRHADKNSRLVSLIRILSESDSFPTKYKDMVRKGYLLSFFGEALGMLSLSGYKSDDSIAMREILKYCSQNFTNDLSLSLLEEELHLSKYYISHLFSNRLGIRFNDYINSLRISEACKYLRSSNASVTEISTASGFGTLRTFNRAFMKRMGMSPSEYRKNNRNNVGMASMPM